MRTTGEIEHPKASARRASRRRVARSSPSGADARRRRDLRRIAAHLRSGARIVLREYLGALRRMGLDPVESATTLGSAFLQAMLEEVRSARVELTHQLEQALRGRDRSSMTRRRRVGERRPGGRRTA